MVNGGVQGLSGTAIVPIPFARSSSPRTPALAGLGGRVVSQLARIRSSLIAAAAILAAAPAGTLAAANGGASADAVPAGARPAGNVGGATATAVHRPPHARSHRRHRRRHAAAKPKPKTVAAPAPPVAAPAPPSAPATLRADGTAVPPAGAPAIVAAVIAAGNRIASLPYRWGGGHARWDDTGYDCSGSVGYALHGGGLLDASATSGDLMSYGDPGPGAWITLYANADHVYMVVAGLRFDTSGADPSRWQTAPRSADGFAVRHPPGL